MTGINVRKWIIDVRNIVDPRSSEGLLSSKESQNNLLIPFCCLFEPHSLPKIQIQQNVFYCIIVKSFHYNVLITIVNTSRVSDLIRVTIWRSWPAIHDLGLINQSTVLFLFDYYQFPIRCFIHKFIYDFCLFRFSLWI